jgi:hypothetical protein
MMAFLLLGGLDQLRGLHSEGGGDLMDARRVDATAALSFRDGVLRDAGFRGQLLDGPYFLTAEFFELIHVYLHTP